MTNSNNKSLYKAIQLFVKVYFTKVLLIYALIPINLLENTCYYF